MFAGFLAVRFVAFLVAPTVLAGQPAENTLQTWEVSDGTIAVLLEEHRAPLVEFRIEFPVGLSSPWARRNHAEEAFEIQMHDAQGRLRAWSEALAAELSVTMDAWKSTITGSCLKQTLPQVLMLVRDMVREQDFDQYELKRRKKSRSIAWRLSSNNPSFRARQAAARLLFDAEDPRRRRWEEPDTILTDVRRLSKVRDTVIRLQNRVIAFAGDLDRTEVEELVANLLPPVRADWPASLKPVLGPITPALERAGEISIALPRLTQVYFAYVRESPDYENDDYPAFMIADHVLGGHFYSRLAVALRHEGGETYTASTVNLGSFRPDIYYLWTYTRSANSQVAESKLKTVLRRFHEDGITEAERSTAAGYFLGRLPFGHQSPRGILARYLNERRYGLPIGYLDALSRRAEQVPLAEINGFIRHFYDPSHFTMVKVLPEGRANAGLSSDADTRAPQ